MVNGRPSQLSPTPASEVVAAIEAAGGAALADYHDVTTDGAAVVATALDRWGRVDIVINNAGGTGGGTVEEMRGEDLLGRRRSGRPRVPGRDAGLGGARGGHH